MKKIGGMLMVLAAIFLIFAGTTGAIQGPQARRDLEKSVWLEENRMDLENEGKIVTVRVKPSDLSGALDNDWNLQFRVPAVKRTVEEFYRADTDQEGNPVWGWRSATDQAEEYQFRGFLGKPTDPNAVELSTEFLPFLATEANVTAKDIDGDCLAQMAVERQPTEVDGMLYFTNVDPACMEKTCVGEKYAPNEGEIRISYHKLSEACEVIAATGIQQGGVLVPREGMDLCVQIGTGEALSDRQNLVHQTTAGMVGSLAVTVIGALIVGYWGLRWIGVFASPRKKQQLPEQTEEQDLPEAEPEEEA